MEQTYPDSNMSLMCDEQGLNASITGKKVTFKAFVNGKEIQPPKSGQCANCLSEGHLMKEFSP